MKFHRLLVCFVLLSVAACAQSDPTTAKSPAAQWIARGLQATGGEQAWRGVHSVRLAGQAYQNFLEQSERPEGPWIPAYFDLRESVDLDSRALRRDLRFAGSFTSWTDATLVVRDGIAAWTPYPVVSGAAGFAAQRFALGPERLLLTAAAAPDLHAEPDTVLEGVPQHVVGFRWKTGAVKLYLSAETGYPTAMDLRMAYPDDSFWGIWGDVTLRTIYTFWDLEAGGRWYPLQWDVEWEGKRYQTFSFSKVEFNPPMDAAQLAISDQQRHAAEAQHQRSRRVAAPADPSEVVPGVVQIRGAWNVEVAEQPDGLVVIEGPFSSEYSAKILELIAARYPGKAVKCVVSTSDAWPHFGGLREYAARGIPIYVLDRNRPIVQQLMDASYDSYPDALARTPRRPVLRPVSGKTVIGSGATRLEIYPLHSETGERMLMVYFPAARLLYGSDLAQPANPNGELKAGYAAELMTAVEREHLDVQTLFAMHLKPMPWARLKQQVEAAR